MKVLLTGGTGFLGRYVLDSLQRRGIDTIVLTRRGDDCRVSRDTLECDLLTSPDLSTLLKDASATHLIHLAWYAEHGQYWTSPLNLRWVEATIRLVEAFCQAGGRQVVIAGSCAEYDWSYGYCREDFTPANPATLYGTAKDAARRLTMALCAAHEVSCAWARIFLPYGSGEDRRRLVPSLIDSFRGLRPAFAVNALAYRDFVHAADVAEAFVTLLCCGANGAFNVSSGQPVQLRQLIQEVALLTDSDAQSMLDLAAMRATEPALLVGENQKIKTFGWQPTLSLTEGLTRMLQEAG